MISPAFILYEYLTGDLSVFTKPSSNGNWPLYKASLPDGPGTKDDLAMVIDTTGILDGRIMPTGEQIEHYGVQITIRSKNYGDGYAKALEVRDVLLIVKNELVVVSMMAYQIKSMSLTTPIVPLGTEEGTKRRNLFTINFAVTVKEE